MEDKRQTLPMEIRNIAIIAHVDHGKTTLTDAIMKQTGMVHDDSVTMDSDTLEKERGITIYSKNASVFYQGTKINIVDTPGHADFGSEVERVLRSIDSVLLVVDAQEGPMPQTRFVLSKSLELGLKPLVIINKIDKPAADPDLAQEKVFELFCDLGANDEQLDFTTVYAVGRDGIAKTHLSDESGDLTPLLDTIISEVQPAPARTDVPLRLQVFNLGYDNFLGRLAVGRIYEGTLKAGSTLCLKKLSGESAIGRVTKLFTFRGLDRLAVEEAPAGDIVMVSGFSIIDIGETLCESADQRALPAITVDEPTVSVMFFANSSPFAGRDGDYVTNKQLRERLEKELEVNVGLRIDFMPDVYTVFGRGELHIAILLENMRREGYEVQVSQPQVIVKKIDGCTCEPFEELTVQVPEKYAGAVIDKIGTRKGLLTNMESHGNQKMMLFEIPTRGLLGYRTDLVVDTRGEGVMYSRGLGFRPHVGEIRKRLVGSMISMASGKASAFSLYNLQERGTLYISPGTEVYEGMIIGNSSRGDDMTVNPVKGKHLTNMRAAGADDAIQLTPASEITIERGLEIMGEDEYLEITPRSVRLRKRFLAEADRKRASRKKRTAA
ncbi:MAG: translational GTPase TypA [Desulfomonilaceae bacterium]|nr:translational GTPase TypA [Desulfomonilaceae bacterium]